MAEAEAGSVDITELQICSLNGRRGGQFYRWGCVRRVHAAAVVLVAQTECLQPGFISSFEWHGA
jgi:hypothetical protein